MSEAAVYRIHWTPGSDLLVGRCHCGAERQADDPVMIWTWLLAHPDHPTDRTGQPCTQNSVKTV